MNASISDRRVPTEGFEGNLELRQVVDDLLAVARCSTDRTVLEVIIWSRPRDDHESAWLCGKNRGRCDCALWEE